MVSGCGSLVTVSLTSLCFPWLQASFPPFGSPSGIPANAFLQLLLNRNLFAEWLMLEISLMGRIEHVEIRPGNFPGLLFGHGRSSGVDCFTFPSVSPSH